MRIVEDASEFPKLFEIQLGLFDTPLEWGIVITDKQIIVFAQKAGEEWAGHSEIAEDLIKKVFPNASPKERRNIFINRIVFIACDPVEELIVNVPENCYLSTNQLYCTLKYLKDMKQSAVIKVLEINFAVGDGKSITCSLEELLLELEQKEAEYYDPVDKPEVIIGISIEEYLYAKQKKKPRT